MGTFGTGTPDAGDDLVGLVVTKNVQGRCALVTVVGEVDIRTASQLTAELTELIQGGRHHLVLDFEGVGFLDSSGLSVLVGALNRLRPFDGSLRMVCTRQEILKILRITGLSRVFPVHENVAEAVAASEAPPETLAAVR